MELVKEKLIFKLEKSVKDTFLMIENVKINNQSYEAKILQEENIEHIIKYNIAYENGKEILKYNITNMNSLENYLQVNKLKKKDLIFIIKSIDEMLSQIENYLLSENSIVLNTNAVMIKKINRKTELFFIAIPNYNSDFSFELSSLIVRLLRYVDINDKEALQLGYELFVRSAKDNYTINDLMTSFENECFDDYDENEYNIEEEVDYDSNTFSVNRDDIDYIEQVIEDIDTVKDNKKIFDYGDNSIDESNEISIDDKTKDSLFDNLIDNFDEVEKFNDKINKGKFENKIIRGQDKVDILKIIQKALWPIIAVSVPFFVFLFFGVDAFIHNINKIFFYEIVLFVLWTFNILMSKKDESSFAVNK